MASKEGLGQSPGNSQRQDEAEEVLLAKEGLERQENVRLSGKSREEINSRRLEHSTAKEEKD